jgi:phage virion morphogenesis protein
VIEVKIDSARAEAVLQNIRARVADPSELMSGVGMLLESMSQQAFRDQGPGWKSLADSTIEQRKKGRGGDSPEAPSWPGQILIRRGGDNGLLGSLFSDSGSNWAQVGAGSGRSAAYAMIHQFGGQAGRGRKTTIPARPYMPITADGDDLTEPAERGILELTMDYLTLD